jgi:acetoin utilization protein AcuC
MVVDVTPAMTAYGFHRGSDEGGRHFFGPHRFGFFAAEAARRGLWDQVQEVISPSATDEELTLFHTADFLETVRACCETNEGSLDDGPTPAEAHGPATAAGVVGAAVAGVRRLLAAEARAVFVPIAGFHHAEPEKARNYCLFNDCAVALAVARAAGARVAYVDIDVHFGDGVFAAFEKDEGVCLIDIHQDGKTFAAGEETEIGPRNEARIVSTVLAPGTEDGDFLRHWDKALRKVRAFAPDLVVLQAGADGLEGDRLGGLSLSELVHRSVCFGLRDVAPLGVLALGGGGYHTENLAAAWCAVLETLVEENTEVPRRRPPAPVLL